VEQAKKKLRCKEHINSINLRSLEPKTVR